MFSKSVIVRKYRLPIMETGEEYVGEDKFRFNSRTEEFEIVASRGTRVKKEEIAECLVYQ